MSGSPSSIALSRDRPTLAELAPLVDAALEQYGVVPVLCESLRYYNNATYRIVAADGQRYVLRVTSNHYKDAELRAEMQWLSAMQVDPDVRVPAPVAARNGHFVVSATAPTLRVPRSCNLFHWMEGTHLTEDRMTLEDFARVGEGAARLHRRSAMFTPPADFERPCWDAKRWLDPHVHGTYANILAHLRRLFSAAAVDRFDDLAQQGRARMRELRSDPRAYGLIHGDFHAGNYLFHEDRVGFIDCEDLGWGYFVYDVATALFGALERPDYPALLNAFSVSYSGTLGLPATPTNDLLVFQVLRAVFLTNLVVTRNSLAESAWWEGYVAGKLRILLE